MQYNSEQIRLPYRASTFFMYTEIVLSSGFGIICTFSVAA